MNLLAIAFLCLEALILALGVFRGYRRGLIESSIRTVYLLLIGVVSFFVSRAVAASLSGVVAGAAGQLAPALHPLWDNAPAAVDLVSALAVALLSPLLFVILFMLLRLLSLIGFRAIAAKLSALLKLPTEDGASGTKWGGAAVGFACALCLSAALLSPLGTVLFVAEDIPENTIAIFTFSYDQYSAPTYGSTEELTKRLSPSINIALFNPLCKPLARGLTGYRVSLEKQQVRENAVDTLPLFLEIAGDALYAYNVTAESQGVENDALTNAAATITPYFERSATVKLLAAELLRAAGQALEQNGEFMGITVPVSEDPILRRVVDKLISALAQTNTETVEANMISMFGKPRIKYVPGETPYLRYNQGLLARMTRIDKDAPSDSLDADQMLAGMVADIAANSNMNDILIDIRLLALEAITPPGTDLFASHYEVMYRGLGQAVADVLTQHAGTDSSIKDMSDALLPSLNRLMEDNGVPVSNTEAGILSTCLVSEFLPEEGLSVGDTVSADLEKILRFFGFADQQLPDWAKDRLG